MTWWCLLAAALLTLLAYTGICVNFERRVRSVQFKDTVVRGKYPLRLCSFKASWGTKQKWVPVRATPGGWQRVGAPQEIDQVFPRYVLVAFARYEKDLNEIEARKRFREYLDQLEDRGE